ncbi:hypothetical protein ACIBO5_55745 [Nonomuraea angiospora]|uniref:hypothetical protein n=1 Tax=Nonomuraea angiospora TaxID=46172 RepID=UPI0029B35CC2|nr:hypothetical protein [Nonomuraea angiospora]MDX3103709.1 hypothetical protein [Nonomuraea angiospora]
MDGPSPSIRNATGSATLARFDSRFHQRVKAWQETELKKEFDERIDHWFDLRFTVGQHPG